MEDLIKTLQILAKYANNDRNPTYCEHDALHVYAGVEAENVTDEDIAKLDKLSFIPNDGEGFISFRFGSC